MRARFHRQWLWVVAAVLCASWTGSATHLEPVTAITLKARTMRPGEVMLVTLAVPGRATVVQVHAFDHSWPAYERSPGQWEAVVGIDLDQAPGDHVLTVDVDGESSAGTKPFTVVARAFPTRTLKVNPDFVNPPASLQKRIEDESKFTMALFATPTPERLWTKSFGLPVPHKANSRFGTRSVFNGEPRNPHAGTDFLSPAGTPIHAPNDGRVVAARDLFFSGRTVILDHGQGIYSQLAHMSRIDVAEGVMVKKGQVVGRVGATGRVTGAHLHWGLRVGAARVDPLSLLAVLGKDTL